MSIPFKYLDLKVQENSKKREFCIGIVDKSKEETINIKREEAKLLLLTYITLLILTLLTYNTVVPDSASQDNG